MNKVQLHTRGRAKFVLMKDHDGNYVLKANPSAEFHRNIVRETSLPYDNCLGGGRIEVSENEIKAYGYSVDFGTAPGDIVEKLLKEHVGDKEVKVTVAMGTGY